MPNAQLPVPQGESAPQTKEPWRRDQKLGAWNLIAMLICAAVGWLLGRDVLVFSDLTIPIFLVTTGIMLGGLGAIWLTVAAKREAAEARAAKEAAEEQRERFLDAHEEAERRRRMVVEATQNGSFIHVRSRLDGCRIERGKLLLRVDLYNPLSFVPVRLRSITFHRIRIGEHQIEDTVQETPDAVRIKGLVGQTEKPINVAIELPSNAWKALKNQPHVRLSCFVNVQCAEPPGTPEATLLLGPFHALLPIEVEDDQPQDGG